MVRYLNDNKFLQSERFYGSSNLKRTAHFNWGIKHQEVKAQMVKDTKQMKKNNLACTTITHAILLGGIINGRLCKEKTVFYCSSLG